MARLYREDGQYKMGIIAGETVAISPEEYETFIEARGSHQLPTAFITMDVDIDRLIGSFGSNHIMGVAGTFVDDLVHTCQLMGIEPVFFN